MEENYQQHYYGKKAIWKWILIYVIAGALVYGLVYFAFFYKPGGYSQQNYQVQIQDSSETVNWKMYENKKYGYQISYPDGLWCGEGSGIGETEGTLPDTFSCDYSKYADTVLGYNLLRVFITTTENNLNSEANALKEKGYKEISIDSFPQIKELNPVSLSVMSSSIGKLGTGDTVTEYDYTETYLFEKNNQVFVISFNFLGHVPVAHDRILELKKIFSTFQFTK